MEVTTECTCGQLPPLPRNQQLDAYDRARWGATLSDADLDAMRARSVAAQLVSDAGLGDDSPDLDAHERAIGGVCSHGGHGYDGETCSDIDDALAPAHQAGYEPDDIYPHLVRAHCTCGWHTAGYCTARLSGIKWEQHAASVGAAPQ